MIEVKDIGELNQRVEFFTRTASASSTYGEVTNTFATAGTFWAKVDFLGGSEAVMDDLALSINRIAITIRYNSTITDQSIAVWNSQRFNIRAIEFDMTKTFMKLTCDTTT